MAGGAGDERVRHLGEILDDGLVGDAVHAEHDGELHGGLRPGFGLDDLAQEHVLAVLVRDLDADGTLTWHRREDAHGLSLEVHRDVIREIGDLLHAHARRGLDLIAGDRRALLDANVDAVDGVDRHAVDLELLEGLDEVGGAFAEILGLGPGVGGGLVEHLNLREDVVAALLDNLAGAGLLDLVGLDDEHLARIGAERLGLLTGGFGFDFFEVVFDRDRLGFLRLLVLIRRVRGNGHRVGLDEIRAYFHRVFMRDIDGDRGDFRGRFRGLLGLGHRDGGADDFLLLTSELGGDGGAAALLFRGGRGGGLTLGVPGAKAVAHLGNPGRQRGLRVVGERAEEAEAVREHENPGPVVAEHRMKDRGEEHTTEHATRSAWIKGDGDILRGAKPEGEDRGEEDDAEYHQGDLDRPERVGALIEREPGRRKEEARHEESRVTEKAEQDDRDGGTKGAARIMLGRRV